MLSGFSAEIILPFLKLRKITPVAVTTGRYPTAKLKKKNQPTIKTMKKLALFSTLLPLLAFSLGGRLYSQAPLNSYQLEKAESQTPFSFTDAATTFTVGAGDTLTHLWLAEGGNVELAKLENMQEQPAEKQGTEIGFVFPFGNKMMTHFGLTAGGFVFFGTGSALYPAVDPAFQTSMAKVQDYVLFQMKALNYRWFGNDYWLNNDVVAGEGGATVKYELSENTLYVGYDGLTVSDTAGNKLEASFQYAFSSDGSVKLTVLSLQPAAEPASDPEKAINYFNFSFGLYSSDLTRSIFLADFATGSSKSGSIPPMILTHETCPAANTGYTFTLPAACAVVSDPQVSRWDFGSTSNSVELGNRMAWNEGVKALFVLSESETLEGGDLPVDGKVYASGDRIGNSKGLAVAEIKNGYAYYDGETISGLEANTSYYLYAFPYDDLCSGGPEYNTSVIPDTVIRTKMGAPRSIRVLASSTTRNAVTLLIDTIEGCHYMLAVSSQEIPANVEMDIEKKAYQAGEKISLDSYAGNFELEVLEPNASDTACLVTGLSAGTDYYFYAWSTDSEGGDYSETTVSCGVSTIHDLTAQLDFESAAANSNAPAGWSFGSEDAHDWFVAEDMESGSKYLAIQRTAFMDDDNNTVPSRNEATTPVIGLGDYTGVSAIVNFYWYAQSWMSASPSAPNEGDTVFIQYKPVSGDEWATVAQVTKAVKTDIDGNMVFEVPEFAPESDFQIRFVSVAETASGMTTPYVAVRNIVVEPVLSCKKVNDLTVDASVLSFDKAKLVWEDANAEWAESFRIRYKEADSAEWIRTFYSRDPEAEIAGLDAHTSYVAEVTAVCGANDTSLSREIEFSTLTTLPYSVELVEGNYGMMSMPSELSIKVGKLPEEGNAQLSDPDSRSDVWNATATPDYTGSVVGIANVAYANNPMWLKLPALAVGDQRGTARIDLALSGSKLVDWTPADPSFRSKDLFLVLVSHDGNFSKESVIDTVDLSTLTMEPRMFSFDFDVDAPTLHVAVYTDFDLSDLTEEHSLFMDTLNVVWENIVCDPVSDIRQSGLTKTSVDISWKGQSLEYAVVYKPRKETGYDTVFTREESCTLSDLLPGTAYEYFVLGYCEEGHRNPSLPSQTRYFNTIAECTVPTLEVIDGSVTWQSVRFAMGSPEKTRIINIYAQDREKYPEINYFVSNNERDTLTVTGLFGAINIPYYAKVRAICAIGDSSDWSSDVSFTTEPVPNCGMPSNLASKVDVDRKVAELSWNNGENNQYQIMMIKEASASKFDTTVAMGNTFMVYDLKLNTSYAWKLMAYCEDYLYSKEVGTQFSTEVSSVESVSGFAQALKVRVSDNQIIVENPEHLYIKSLDVFSVNGKLLRSYSANTTENVFIYHDLQEGLALIRVVGPDNTSATYKAVIL